VIQWKRNDPIDVLVIVGVRNNDDSD